MYPLFSASGLINGRSVLLLVSLCLGCSDSSIDSTQSESATATENAMAVVGRPAYNDVANLSVSSGIETLILDWTNQPDTNRVHVYQKSQNENDVLLETFNSSDIDSIQIPSNTPNRNWDTDLFRIELCNGTLCQSSPYKEIKGLAAQTGHTLRPAVFVFGEQYAQSATVNSAGKVLFSALPTAGAVEIHLHQGSAWTRIQQLNLPDQAISRSRQLELTSTTSGDSFAVFSDDESTDLSPQFYIIERLGEAWLTTATIPVQTDSALTTAESDETDIALQISDTTDRLFFFDGQAIQMYSRNSVEWTRELLLAPDAESQWLSAITDSAITHLIVLTRDSQGLWLTRWFRIENRWQETSRHAIQGIRPFDDVRLALDSDAGLLLVSGWDDVPALQRYPVLQRYALDTDDQINILDSFRGDPAWSEYARLRFTSSADLQTVALGWQDNSTDSASISTYTFDATQRQWLQKLQLPGAAPTLAKQAFAHRVELSGDGRTLLISNASTNSADTLNRVGELLVFR